MLGCRSQLERKKIDVAIENGVPSFIQVLKNVLTELEIQKVYLANEIKTANPAQLEQIKKSDW